MGKSPESRRRQIHRLQMRVWGNLNNRPPENPAPVNQEQRMDPKILYKIPQNLPNQ